MPVSRLTLVAVALLFATFAASARADPCVLDGGTIDTAGKCDGDDAVFCQSNSLTRLHCPALPIDATETLNGGDCRVLDNIGAWCTFPPAVDCAFTGPSGDPVYFGCGFPDEDETNFACDLRGGCADVSNTPLLFGCLSTAPRCFGSHLRIDCTAWAQAVTIDCASSAERGVCNDPGNGDATCVNGVGGECDDVLLTCAAGLVCTGAGAQLGHCTNPNGSDAGPAADAGAQSDAGAQADAGVVHDGGTVRDGGTVHDAGTTGRDAGSAGEGEGEGSGDTDPGTPLGSDTGGTDHSVDEQPPPSSGCGCGAASPGGALFGAVVVGAVFLARRRR